MLFMRDVLFRVVFACVTGNSIGTGMFVHADKNVWLVTANHVAEKCTRDSIAVFQADDGSAIRVPLVAFNSMLAWRHHRVADLSCLQAFLTPLTAGLLQNRCYPMNQIHAGHQCVSRDDELTTIGFPLGLGMGGKISPLTFRSFAASSFFTAPRADTKTMQEFFCLENPSVGGYSGGPVFDVGYIKSAFISQSKGETICYGFMHGTMLDDTGGKMALVVPAYYLSDLIT